MRLARRRRCDVIQFERASSRENAARVSDRPSEAGQRTPAGVPTDRFPLFATNERRSTRLGRTRQTAPHSEVAAPADAAPSQVRCAANPTSFTDTNPNEVRDSLKLSSQFIDQLNYSMRFPPLQQTANTKAASCIAGAASP